MRANLFMLLIFTAATLYAQTDSTVFNNLKRIELNEYVLNVPEKWKKADMIDQASKDRKFDFSGVGIPMYYNSAPLSATFTLRKYDCDSLPPAEHYILEEITSIPDRITPAGYNYERDTLKIASGETGILYATHFFRRSKALNYVRYDMVVYSIKRKAAYILNATYQFTDPEYEIEKKLNLKGYAIRVFKGFLMR